MATPLQSSGQISLNDIRQYIGQSGEISLSNIIPPYSINQVFNSSLNSVFPLTSVYFGRCFLLSLFNHLGMENDNHRLSTSKLIVIKYYYSRTNWVLSRRREIIRIIRIIKLLYE